MAGLIGTKKGMTRIFDDSGRAITVTVVEAAGTLISAAGGVAASS